MTEQLKPVARGQQPFRRGARRLAHRRRVGEDCYGFFDRFEVVRAEYHGNRATVPSHCDSLMGRDDLVDDF